MNETQQQQQQLNATFAALSDPTRRAILARLTRGEASVSELAKPFEMTTRAISKHIAVLEEAGLIDRSQDAQRRPSRLRTQPLAEVDRWLETYRRLWNARFDRLATRLKQQQQEEKQQHERATKRVLRRTPR
jgi:DNA-binding transcriptional ArsR family regulator